MPFGVRGLAASHYDITLAQADECLTIVGQLQDFAEHLRMTSEIKTVTQHKVVIGDEATIVELFSSGLNTACTLIKFQHAQAVAPTPLSTGSQVTSFIEKLRQLVATIQGVKGNAGNIRTTSMSRRKVFGDTYFNIMQDVTMTELKLIQIVSNSVGRAATYIGPNPSCAAVRTLVRQDSLLELKQDIQKSLRLQNDVGSEGVFVAMLSVLNKLNLLQAELNCQSYDHLRKSTPTLNQNIPSDLSAMRWTAQNHLEMIGNYIIHAAKVEALTSQQLENFASKIIDVVTLLRAGDFASLNGLNISPPVDPETIKQSLIEAIGFTSGVAMREMNEFFLDSRVVNLDMTDTLATVKDILSGYTEATPEAEKQFIKGQLEDVLNGINPYAPASNVFAGIDDAACVTPAEFNDISALFATRTYKMSLALQSMVGSSGFINFPYLEFDPALVDPANIDVNGCLTLVYRNDLKTLYSSMSGYVTSVQTALVNGTDFSASVDVQVLASSGLLDEALSCDCADDTDLAAYCSAAYCFDRVRRVMIGMQEQIVENWIVPLKDTSYHTLASPHTFDSLFTSLKDLLEDAGQAISASQKDAVVTMAADLKHLEPFCTGDTTGATTTLATLPYVTDVLNYFDAATTSLTSAQVETLINAYSATFANKFSIDNNDGVAKLMEYMLKYYLYLEDATTVGLGITPTNIEGARKFVAKLAATLASLEATPCIPAEDLVGDVCLVQRYLDPLFYLMASDVGEAASSIYSAAFTIYLDAIGYITVNKDSADLVHLDSLDLSTAVNAYNASSAVTAAEQKAVAEVVIQTMMTSFPTPVNPAVCNTVNMGFCEYLTGPPAPATPEEWLESIDVELVTLLNNWFVAGLDTTFGSVQTFSSYKAELATLETQVLPLYALAGTPLADAVAVAKPIVDPILANIKLITAKTILSGQPKLTTECQQISTVLKFYKANTNSNLDPSNLITAMQKANENRATQVYPQGTTPMSAFANAFLEFKLPSLDSSTVDDAIVYAERQEARCADVCTGGAAMKTLCLALKSVDTRLNDLLDFNTASTTHDAFFAEIDSIITGTSQTIDSAAAWTSAYGAYTTASTGLDAVLNDSLGKALIQITMGSFYLATGNADLYKADVMDASDLSAFFQFVIKDFLAVDLKTKLNVLALLSYEFGVKNSQTATFGDNLSIADFNTALDETWTHLKTMFNCADSACRLTAFNNLPSTFFESLEGMMSYDGVTGTENSNTNLDEIVNPTYFFEMETLDFNSSEAAMKTAINLATTNLMSKYSWVDNVMKLGVAKWAYALTRKLVIDSDPGAGNEGDIDSEDRATAAYGYIAGLYNSWKLFKDTGSDPKYRCVENTQDLYIGDELCFIQKMLLPEWTDADDDIGAATAHVDIVGTYQRFIDILESTNNHLQQFVLTEGSLSMASGETEILSKLVEEYTNSTMVSYELHAELGFLMVRLLYPAWDARQGFGPSSSCEIGKGNYYRPDVTKYITPNLLTECENTMFSFCALQKEVVLRDIYRGVLAEKGADFDFVTDWSTEYATLKPNLLGWISDSLTFTPSTGHNFTIGASFTIPFRSQANLIFHHLTATPMVDKALWTDPLDFIKHFQFNLDAGAPVFIGASHSEELELYRLYNQSHEYLYGDSDSTQTYASTFTSPSATLAAIEACTVEWYCNSPTVYTHLNALDTVIAVDWMGQSSNFVINGTNDVNYLVEADPLNVNTLAAYQYRAFGSYANFLNTPDWDTFCTSGCSAPEMTVNQDLINSVKTGFAAKMGIALATTPDCY
jgi:hypothetical protein